MTREDYTASIDDDGLQIVQRTRKPKVTCMATVEPRDIDWLWEGRIPAGRITVLSGRPGGGKSFVTVDLAARISTGRLMPDGSQTQRGSVLTIACEDNPADTIRPRLDAAGADPECVHLLSGIEVYDGKQTNEYMFSLASVDMLEQTLEALPDCRLVIIDPIGSYIGGDTKTGSDNEVRAVLAPIAKVAERTGVAVLIVAHTRKAEAVNIDDTVMGSRAFTGIARSVWHLLADPENDQRRLLLQGKCNIAPEIDGMAFQIEGKPAFVTWNAEPVTQTANEILAMSYGKRGRGASAVDEAAEWLRRALADGQQPSKGLIESATADGIAERTLRKAATKLNVFKKPGCFGGGWVWELTTESASVDPVSSELTTNPYLVNSGKTDARSDNNETHREASDGTPRNDTVLTKPDQSEPVSSVLVNSGMSGKTADSDDIEELF